MMHILLKQGLYNPISNARELGIIVFFTTWSFLIFRLYMWAPLLEDSMVIMGVVVNTVLLGLFILIAGGNTQRLKNQNKIDQQQALIKDQNDEILRGQVDIDIKLTLLCKKLEVDINDIQK